jgi:hypothetical protein
VVSYYDSLLSIYFFVLSSVFSFTVLVFSKHPAAQGKTKELFLFLFLLQ